jgi:hypothetical protein
MSDLHLLADLEANHRALQRDGATIYSRAADEIDMLQRQLATCQGLLREACEAIEKSDPRIISVGWYERAAQAAKGGA